MKTKPSSSVPSTRERVLPIWLLPVATIALLAIGLLFAARCIWFDGKPSLAYLGVAVGWGGSFLIGLLGVAVIYKMFDGSIDLSKLVSEPTGEASMSRFQLLVFTFVIAVSLLLITVGHPGGPEFPKEIPPAILGLLGISAGSYVISKGLQKDITLARLPVTVSISAALTDVVPGQAVTISASVTGAGDFAYQWQRLAPGAAAAEDLVGKTDAVLTVTPASVAESGTQYRCHVTNATTEATSDPITITVHADRG
jgi:putative Mn2+ efflux pump MntP